MASLLDGIASSIYAGFKGKLRTGVIRLLEGGTGQDGHGRPEAQTPRLVPLEGFPDNYSAFTRAQAGIAQDSVKVCLFGKPLAEAGVVPSKDMMVRLDLPSGPQWYKLRTRIETDPAEALWECEAQTARPPV